MPEIKKVSKGIIGSFGAKKTIPNFPINPNEKIEKDNLNIITPMVKPIGIIDEMLQNKDKINFLPPSLPVEKKDNVNTNSHPLSKNYHYLVDSDSPISPKYNQPKQNNVANVFDDVGTQLLNSVQTFGGSIIGDAVNTISPTAADVIEKYSGGIIPHTSQQQFESNRGDNKNAWENRTSNTANAVTTAIIGEMLGAGMNWGANKIASGELKNKAISLFKKPNNLINKIDNIIPENNIGIVDNPVKLVERKQVFDEETLASIERYNKYFGKNIPNSPLTMADKLKIGRDVATQKKLDRAYRNTHIDEVINAKKQGYFNNNRFPDTDWYYGGSSSKYGNIEVEAIPDSKYFRLFEVDGKYTGIVTPNKNILHLKGSNVPFKDVIIRHKGEVLTDDILEEISKQYKKGDNLDELIYSIKNQTKK